MAPAAAGKVFSCYLLRSLSEKGHGRTYIGFTINPLRRLRQHNGEIKGGAAKTKRLMPWELVLVVHGFSNKIIALQFEYAWQKPERSRLLRQAFTEHVNRRRAAQLEAKLVVLALALNTPPFSSQPLGVHLFECAHARPHWDARTHARLLAGEMHIAAVPDHMLARITHGDAALCPELSRVRADESDSDSDGAAADGDECQSWAASEEEVVGEADADAHSRRVGTPCFICALEIERRAVACACGTRCHPTCLAAAFLPPADDAPLMPAGGPCPACHAYALWPDLVRRGLAVHRPAARAPARAAPPARLAEAPRAARAATAATAEAAVEIDCTLDDSEASVDEGSDGAGDARAVEREPLRAPPAHSSWRGGDGDAERSASPTAAAADDYDWQPAAWADDEPEWAPDAGGSDGSPSRHVSAERPPRAPEVMDMTLSDDDDDGGDEAADDGANARMRRADAPRSPAATGGDAALSDDDSDAGCYDMRPLAERLGVRAARSADAPRPPLPSVADGHHRTVIELDDTDSEPE